jgi:hypothetical protein
MPLDNESRMTAAVVSDLNNAFSRVSIDTSTAATGEARIANRNDAHLGIKELAVLRLDFDMVAPPEAAELGEPLVEMYQGTLTSGDHLRLDQRTNHSGAAIRAAVGRVLATDPTAAASSQDAVLKEAKMRRMLQALDGAVADIQRRAAVNSRD